MPKGTTVSDTIIDAMDAAYWAEFDRWHARRKLGGGYELVRTLNDQDVEVVNLTKRDVTRKTLSPGQMAGSWLNTYRSRAAMRAALAAEYK